MVGRLVNIQHDAHMYWLSWRTQFKAATKLRGAFVLQIFGMMLNNTGLMLGWWFLFQHFGTVNGWTAADLIGVNAANMLIFGIAVIFTTGFYELPRYVDQGSFDTFLTKPVGLVAQVASSSIEVSTLGDILLGIALLTWYIVHVHASLFAIALFALAVATGAMLLCCFVLMCNLLAFYMFDSEKVARNILYFYIDTGIYPSGILSGGLRLTLLTVFPGLFIGAVPLDVLRGVNSWMLLVGFVVSAVWLIIASWLFRRSVRKYESANLVGAR